MEGRKAPRIEAHLPGGHHAQKQQDDSAAWAAARSVEKKAVPVVFRSLPEGIPLQMRGLQGPKGTQDVTALRRPVLER